MARPRREVSIFNLSMLDVVSGALGAFLILIAVLLPWYQNENARELRECRAENAELASELADCRAQVVECQAQLEACGEQIAECRDDLEACGDELAECRGDLESCEDRAAGMAAEIQNAGILVLIQWASKEIDVDLHVTDATGAEFNYETRVVEGRPGQLSADTVKGPGVEVWELQPFAPGRYTIAYNLFERNGNSENPRVTGRVYHRLGSADLPAVTLREQHKLNPAALRERNLKVFVAHIDVAADGRATVAR